MEITSVSTNATTLYIGEQLIVTFQAIDRILDNRGNPILDSSGNAIVTFQAIDRILDNRGNPILDSSGNVITSF